MAYRLTDRSALAMLIRNDEYVLKINEVRSIYDKAYPRWVPHINLIYQFVTPDHFAEVSSVLDVMLKDFGSFNIHLDEVGFFNSGKGATIHLKASDSSKIDQMYKAIRSILPLIRVQREVFAPHLTIAQVPLTQVEEKMVEFRAWLGKGFTFEVCSIFVLERSLNDNAIPFHIAKEIRLT